MGRRACIAAILLPLATLRPTWVGQDFVYFMSLFLSDVNITIAQSDLPGTQRDGRLHVPAADAPRASATFDERHTMHSSSLRGTDFEIMWRGRAVFHAEFFSSVRDSDRVGIVIPHRFEGIGAITLIMSYVTAFYDRYRERGPEFFAYPDFFTFQHESPCADYGMFDIWPYHKNVHVSQDAQSAVEAITDRGVTVLLVPDNGVSEVAIAAVELESARRNIRRCFAYSENGTMISSDLVIECQSHLLRDFALAVLESVPADDALQKQRERWLERMATGTLSQSFRELDLNEALRRI